MDPAELWRSERKYVAPDFRENPHMAQLGKEKAGVFAFHELDRVLRDDAPRKPYQFVPHNQRSVNHWGQRKLLLSEIEFLTLHGEPGALIVYAGAAPGTHTAYLADLFPDMKFLCVDPAEFKLKGTDRIEVRNGFFTDDTVEELKSKTEPILFISDIRTGDPKVQSNKEVEEAVKYDQELQKNWVLKLNPKASMLKFRLPWEGGSTNYLKGDIYLPIWGRETTTETRLISVSPFEIVPYDNKKYEEQCFHFNRVTRVQWYDHPVMAEGMDHCFDCASEDFVLQEYLKKHSKCAPEDLVKEAREMSERISKECSPHSQRTLKMSEGFDDRQKWFTPRVYDYENRTLKHVARVNNPKAQYSDDHRSNRRASDHDDRSRKRGSDQDDRSSSSRRESDHGRRSDDSRRDRGGKKRDRDQVEAEEEEEVDYGGLEKAVPAVAEKKLEKLAAPGLDLFRYRVEKQAAALKSKTENLIEFGKLDPKQYAIVESVMESQGLVASMDSEGYAFAESKEGKESRGFGDRVERHLKRLETESQLEYPEISESCVKVIMDKVDEKYFVDVKELGNKMFSVLVKPFETKRAKVDDDDRK